LEDKRLTKKIKSVRAFTLLEIAFALMLLSGALVVIVGLQSSAISRTVSDRNIQKAALIARSIMSAIEIDPTLVQEQDETESADKVLARLIRTRDTTKEEREEQSSYMVQLRVEPIEIVLPPTTILELKRFDVTVFSADKPENSFNVVFISKNK
jgi:competence protein ComGC